MSISHIDNSKMFVEQLVSALYSSLLRRAPETGAVEHWVDAVGGGMSLEKLIEAFLGCEEFKSSNLSNNMLFVPPGHFYSPVVNTDAIASVFEKAPLSEAAGIVVDKIAHVEVWKMLLPHIKRIPFPQKKCKSFRYFFENPAYGIGDASVYFAMLLEHRPKRIIEVGSGYSSACALDAIELFFSHDVDVSFVEPYPDLLHSLMRSGDEERFNVYPCGVQDVDLDVFRMLEAGDILFLDSTHVLKTGSDVNHELFNVLPALNKGVIIHIHDIFWPFEYPRDWVMKEKRSWNELYALRAYLMFQDKFKILFFNDFFAQECRSLIEVSYPAMLQNTGGSLWLQKMD